MLEVCIDSLESALNAIHGGADEIEVCSSLAEGGLTPSAGLVREIQSTVNNVILKKYLHKSCPKGCHCIGLHKKPKVNVMLRCRTGSDFCYSILEMETMLADLEVFKTFNIDRFVFGAIDNTKNIDWESCKRVVDLARPIPVTFHRAFDICKSPIQSLTTIIELGFNRVLTSGQQSSAADPKAVNLINELLNKFKDEIEIMPGAGITYDNAKSFLDIGCTIIHSSCKKVVKLPKYDDLCMGSNESTYLIVTDEQQVRKIKAITSSSC